MPVEFHKMHGAGNDFVVLDLRDQSFELTPENAARIADRRLGVGCDQILVIRDAHDSRHLARYEVRNADGSSAGQCGNGARCIALYLYRQSAIEEPTLSLESPTGIVTISRSGDGEFEVEMAIPDFEPAHVPIATDRNDGLYRLDSRWGTLEFGAVSMGNPHAVTVVDSADNPDITGMGRYISTHAVFPEGCNAGFAEILDSGKIRLRVIERGVGETLACGSGACAAVAVLAQRGLVGEQVDVVLPGGVLVIKWPGVGRPVRMKGPAKYVFKGSWNE